MKHPIRSTFAVVTFLAAAPAGADIIRADSSDSQGILVHGSGTAQTDTEVAGQLGVGSGIDVLFSGTTEGDPDNLMIQGGTGQADVTGALDPGGSPNDTFGINSLSIGLENDAAFDWIELSLFGTGDVSFTLLDGDGNPFTSDADGAFTFALVNGQNKFAFQAVDGQSITGLLFDVVGGTVDTVKQVRIDPLAAVVPEPATWGMMILGFGAIGFAMRRKRRPVLAQIA